MSTPPSNALLSKYRESREAAIAVDFTDRIVLWNKACEQLLGRPAQAALGKHCWDVLCGRDSNGNVYCHASCPAAFQARGKAEEPVRPFVLEVRTGDDRTRRVSMSFDVIPNVRLGSETVIHILADAAVAPARSAARAEVVARSVGAAAAEPAVDLELTGREREVLRAMAAGLPTPSIGKKLGIATVTVRNHVQSILQKLEVHNKVAAVALAYRHKLI
jgi:DNA-binding CsgD family transcriptional regulator